jgi:hypothetical protein
LGGGGAVAAWPADIIWSRLKDCTSGAEELPPPLLLPELVAAGGAASLHHQQTW